MGNERWASRRRLRYLWAPVGGRIPAEPSDNCFSRPKRFRVLVFFFFFCGQSKPVGAKNGHLFTEWKDTPNSPKSPGFGGGPFDGGSVRCGISLPLLSRCVSSPVPSIPYQGRRGGRLHVIKLRDRRPPLLFVLFLIFQSLWSRVPPSIHYAKCLLFLFLFLIPATNHGLWMGDAPS